MPAIPKTYASPGLRWGLFLHDHPAAPDPTFRLARYDDPEVNVPKEFSEGGEEGFSGDFCVCTIDPADGGKKITAWREIPAREKRGGSWVSLSRTPENWRKLTTMALGRALKQAGYADDTEDLKALLLWRRRDVELKALAAGVSSPPALESGPPPSEADLDRAARPTPAEHPDHPGHDDHAEPDDEVYVDPDAQWQPEAAEALRPLVEQMTEEQVLTLQEYADSKGWGPVPAVTGAGPLRTLKARAAALLAAAKTGTKATNPSQPPLLPAPEAPTAGSGQPAAKLSYDPEKPAQRAKVLALHRAVISIDDDKILDSLITLDPIFGELTDDTPMTLGQVQRAWEILKNHGIDG